MRKLVIFLTLLSAVIFWLTRPAEVQMVEMDVKEEYNAPAVNLEPVEPRFNISLDAELQELVYNECMDREIEPELAVAVMLQENYYFDPSIISGTNDYGLFQINKVNHKRMAYLGYVDMLDAEDNIKAGVYILAECLASSDTYEEALMAYNMGRAGCNRAMAKGIYSTAYSRGVMAYYEGLKAGESYE